MWISRDRGKKSEKVLTGVDFNGIQTKIFIKVLMDLFNPQHTDYIWLFSANLQLNCENGS